MFYQDEDTCRCGSGQQDNDDCDCTDGCDCGCESCGEDQNSGVITMTDAETGQEYTFQLVDDFVYQDEHYCVLVTADDDQEPEMVITRVVTMEDGTEGLMSLDDDEYDRVYAEFDRLCEEADEEEDDDEEED